MIRQIMEERKRLIENQLQFVKQVIQTALELSIYTTIEHPHGSAMWRTEPMESMTGYYDVVVHRCRTGLVAKDKRGNIVGPIKKPTRLRTTSPQLAGAMDLKCRCLCDHVQMTGRGQDMRSLQNYEKGFATIAAEAVVHDAEVLWARRQADLIAMTDDLPHVAPDHEHAAEAMNKSLVRKYGRNAVLTIAKLHKQLGHPGRDRLVKAAQDSRLDQATVQAAREFSCATCDGQAASKTPRPGNLTSVTCFSQVVLVDAFYIKWHDKKLSILAIMDSFSRFEQLALLENDRPDTEIALLEQLWLRWAGPPSVLKTDASGSHMSEPFLAWADSRGIRLVLIPKEAHYRLGTMERAHAVRRAQLMKMHAEEPTLELPMALHLAAEQRNRLRTIHGTSPAAIVFGLLPAQHGIADEPFNPAAGDEESQAKIVQARTLAATSFHQANNDRALRASILARGRASCPELPLGSYCYYTTVRITSCNLLVAGAVRRLCAPSRSPLCVDSLPLRDLWFTGWPTAVLWCGVLLSKFGLSCPGTSRSFA